MNALESGFAIAFFATLAEARMRVRGETSDQAVDHLAREFELTTPSTEALRRHFNQ